MNKNIFILLLLTSACSHTTLHNSRLQLIEFPEQELAKTSSQQSLLQGGYSGLIFLGTYGDEWEFMTHTDRGPNPEAIAYVSGVGRNVRPFVLPDFQPHWVRFRVRRNIPRSLRIVETIPLHSATKRLSGLPPFADSSNETPIALDGRKLEFDHNGVDLEAIAQTPEGHFWMSDEYWPAILEFDSHGSLLRQITPNTQHARIAKFQSLLPIRYSQRRSNRGFESLAFQDGHIFAILQSPLKSEAYKKTTPMIELDPHSNKIIREYDYPLTDADADKVGDMVSIGNGRFLVLEQNSASGPKSIHKVYEIDIRKTADVLSKRLVVDLVLEGYDFAEKVEGLAIIGPTHIAVLNDNDFQLDGTFDLSTQKVGIDSRRKSILGIIQLERPISE